MIAPLDFLLLLIAAFAAGCVNAIAGGGSIFTFPVLLAVGVPPVSANITNTVALCPGYVGGVVGQWRDLAGQGRRLAILLPVAALGGVIGAWLLTRTSDRTFMALVPALVPSRQVPPAQRDLLPQVVTSLPQQAHNPHSLPRRLPRSRSCVCPVLPCTSQYNLASYSSPAMTWARIRPTVAW